VPLRHTWPAAHALPQAPQFAGSDDTLTQHGTAPVCLHCPGGAGSTSASAVTGTIAATELIAIPASTLRRDCGVARVRDMLSNQRSDQPIR